MLNIAPEQTELMEAMPVAAWVFRFPLNAHLADWSDIDVQGRSRSDFGNLEELAQDIQKNGLIHPPTVTLAPAGSERKYTLVGGERRMKAMKLLEVPQVPVNIREELEAHEILEMELMENFHRKQMLWQEQCILIAKTHKEKSRVAALDYKSWGMRETGTLLGLSAASVTHATVLTPFLVNGDAEILAASSMYGAYEILLKRDEDEGVRLAMSDMNATAMRASNAMGIRASSDDVDDIFGKVLDVDTNAFGGAKIDEFIHDPDTAKLNLDFRTLFHLGDCLEIMPKHAPESVDHIVTDPPYGIDVESMMEGLKNVENVVETHDREQNISMFEPFLENAFRLLRPAGYCMFWYDIEHHEKLQALASKVGFRVQRWPLVWNKLHPCKNQAPRVNFTKNVEFVMVCRKSTASTLTTPQTSCLFSCDGQADRKLYDNPFAKPLLAWKFMLSAIAYKGQSIYDPYAGQMSCGRACINMGLVPMGCEIDEKHYLRGIMNLQNLTKEING